MSYDIKKHFPYAKIREQQSLAILYALRNFLQHDKRFVIIEAGTGVGKSAIGLTVGSIEQIYLLGEELGYGGGQRINVIAGAIFCPLIGSIIYSKVPQVGQTGYLRGAAYGALLAPIGAIVGYHLSKNSLF